MHVDAMTVAPERRRFLACLSDPSRFSLVTMLADGPRCVTELASLVGLSQSCTTRHLQALLRESIVVAERRGKRVVYALRREGQDVHPVLRWACEPAGAPVAGDGDPGQRTRTRPRASVAHPAFEPEPGMSVAVEHESGWVEADLPPPPHPRLPATDRSEVSGVPPDNETHRSRTEMDDFLL
jgi:DNA-binding transcriptional ArsR family regulator